MKYFLLNFLFLLFYFLLLILLVAYFTLLERKIISAVQRRKGPDYVGFFGILQPISDALKLLFKKFIIPKASYFFIFFISPIFTLFFSILL